MLAYPPNTKPCVGSLALHTLDVLALMQVWDSRIQEVEAGGSQVQLHSKFKSWLSYTRPCLKQNRTIGMFQTDTTPRENALW